MTRSGPAGRVVRALAVGVVIWLFYAALGSKQYTAVDGALRCLDVFRHPALAFAGANHLLYPAWVLAWHRLLGLFGATAGDPFTFLRTTQLMNATAAAGALALVYWIVAEATTSEAAALAAVAGTALSRAFLLHATSSAEPVVGIWWALVALAASVVARRRPSALAAALAGLALALGCASYASMLLVAPAAALLLGRGDGAGRRLLTFFASAAAVSLGIFGFAYAAASRAGMADRFVPGISIWGGLSVARAAHLPLGFAQSLLPVLPPGYGGLRSLAHGGSTLAKLWLVGAVTGIAALGIALVWSALRAWRRADRGTLETPVAVAVGLVAALAAPLAWDPMYDKLWLLPLALVFSLGGLLAAAGAGARRGVTIGALVLIAAEGAVNLSWAIPAHRFESPYLEPARVVARAAQPGDLLVLDWDPVSELFSGVWGNGTTVLTLPTEGVFHGAAALATLDSAVAATERRGEAVYFLGILDETPASWNAFLGQRLHLPYAALDRYRDSAVVTARFHAAGSVLTLRRLAAPAPAATR